MSIVDISRMINIRLFHFSPCPTFQFTNFSNQKTNSLASFVLIYTTKMSKTTSLKDILPAFPEENIGELEVEVLQIKGRVPLNKLFGMNFYVLILTFIYVL